ncbi:MAG TPA: hypothetical protein VNQ74_04715, partial [Burkholderiaceae bacterium]|nr:hypothetical protein [Burkholderiaceae bacterium]
MRRISLLIVLIAAISSAQAVDYTNAVITGVGLSSGDGNLRFTIDKDPNAIFTTNQFTGEQLKRVTALILAAYHAQSPVAFIRSTESSSASVRHYTGLSDV